MNNILLQPVISEKSFMLAGQGVYVFEVNLSANKHSVATEVHKHYKVDVIEVNIINTSGKVKKVGRKVGKRSDVKKALVKVKSGQKIAIFETEEDKKNKSEKNEDKKADKLEDKSESK